MEQTIIIIMTTITLLPIPAIILPTIECSILIIYNRAFLKRIMTTSRLIYTINIIIIPIVVVIIIIISIT